MEESLQLKVNAGHYTPYYYVGDGQRIAFVRVGDESLPASAEQMVRLVLKGSNKTFDSLHTGYKAGDNSFSILANSFKQRTGQDWNKKYLLSFGLVTSEGHLTNAGALFADDCNLSQSRLYCTRWNGLENSPSPSHGAVISSVAFAIRSFTSVSYNTFVPFWGTVLAQHGQARYPTWASTLPHLGTFAARMLPICPQYGRLRLGFLKKTEFHLSSCCFRRTKSICPSPVGEGQLLLLLIKR